MLGITLVVLSVILGLATAVFVYCSTLRKEVDVPTALFEDGRVVVYGQYVPIEDVPKKYLTVKNHGVPKGTLMANLEVKSKKTGSTWKCYLKYDQECHIEVPGRVLLEFKGITLKTGSYARSKEVCVK